MIMTRITTKQLESLVNDLNVKQGTPIDVYRDGKACINNYHIDWAYGGCQLHQMVNDGGGIKSISNNGYGTKKELYTFLKGALSF